MAYLCESKSKMLMFASGYSSQNTSNPSPYSSRFATSPRYLIPSYHTPSLSLHAPPPSHRFGASRLSCCPLDSTSGLGSCPYCRQCQAYSTQRKGGEKWPSQSQRFFMRQQRATHCAMENVRQDQRKRNGRTVSGHRSQRAG